MNKLKPMDLMEYVKRNIGMEENAPNLTDERLWEYIYQSFTDLNPLNQFIDESAWLEINPFIVKDDSTIPEYMKLVNPDYVFLVSLYCKCQGFKDGLIANIPSGNIGSQSVDKFSVSYIQSQNKNNKYLSSSQNPCDSYSEQKDGMFLKMGITKPFIVYRIRK